jgi:hypothetical protein
MCGAVRRVLAVRQTRGLLLVEEAVPSATIQRLKKIKVIRVECYERVHSANACRMDSSNSSFTTNLCACAAVIFLAGLISLSVDYKPVLPIILNQ